mgnify:CR=1 FL=1
MKEPLPFNPLWSATIGPVVHRGKGLLDNEVNALRALIEKFEVHMGTYTIGVLPKLGMVYLDSSCTTIDPGPLLWFRRMRFEMGTEASNRQAACLWYGVGIGIPGNGKGFRVFEDGRLDLEIN